ncbi:MAG: sodium-translocating pyrophosphatase [Candidatus Caldarchaeum sp.]
MEPVIAAFPVIVSILAFLTAVVLYAWLKSRPAGDEKIRNISSAVREGSKAFLAKELNYIASAGALIAFLLTMLISPVASISFIVGATLSVVAAGVAVMTCVSAAPRAAASTVKTLGQTFITAFRGGATAGLFITAMALTAIAVLYLLFQDPLAIAGAGFGASLVALFIRAGGGIYTKAADLGADLVGKVEAGIPEDDPRNPATIADNVGDNVGDAAGMGADVYESYVVTLLASMLIGSLIGRAELVFFPLLLAGAGLIGSVAGVLSVSSGLAEKPSTSLNTSFIVAAVATILIGSLIAFNVFGGGGVFNSVVLSLLLGAVLAPMIQRITDYYTSYSYSPTKKVAESTKIGHSANILEGVSLGLRSNLPFALSIVAAVLISYYVGYTATGQHLFGVYCTALTTMAMLSLSGIVLSIDSFGPVSDNAGGLVEMAGMGEENRKLTDALDAIGNTTKATTKGFAIASAGLAAIAMLQAFQYEAEKVLGQGLYSLSNPAVIVGLLIGGLLPFYVSSRLISAVGATASKIVEEVRHQFRTVQGILEGVAKPDYGRVVSIATAGAVRELVVPAAIVVLTPIVVGVLLGPEAVAGVLMGGVVSGLYLAYHMANSGAAWDNAKKYLEYTGRKKTPEHAVAVSGDLVGDPYKDTAGPSLNTVIKVLNTVAIVFVPIFIGLL